MGLKQSIKRRLTGGDDKRPRKIKGGTLKGRLFPIDPAVDTMKLYGWWEREIAKDVTRLAKGAKTGCDVGSNTGWYALTFAIEPTIEKVFAIEADPQFDQEIRENLSIDGGRYKDKTVFLTKFVGNQDDDTHCKLDTVLKDAKGPIVLKIDVEGAELDVLKGAEAALKSKECRLIVETHSLLLEQECDAYLQAIGYRTKIIKNGWYRIIIPEGRHIDHNRWITAVK